VMTGFAPGHPIADTNLGPFYFFRFP